MDPLWNLHHHATTPAVHYLRRFNSPDQARLSPYYSVAVLSQTPAVTGSWKSEGQGGRVDLE